MIRPKKATVQYEQCNSTFKIQELHCHVQDFFYNDILSSHILMDAAVDFK